MYALRPTYLRTIIASTMFHHRPSVVQRNMIAALHSEKQPSSKRPDRKDVVPFGWSRHEGGEQNSVVNRISSFTIATILGLGLYKGYQKYHTKKRREESCEPLPDCQYIQANLPLVRYRGCVLPESLVMSGTMEDISQFQFRPDDIIVASFPKSGTTWLQEVVYLLGHLGREEPEEFREAVMETKFPYLEFSYPGLNDISKREGRRFVKTHLPCHLLPESIASSNAKVLYIYRNPKDVAVSYFHFAQMLTYIDFVGKFEKFAKMMISGTVPYAPYFPHVHDYRKMSIEKPKQFLTLAYEDMQEDPKREISKIANFLGIKVEDEDVEAIAAKTSFEAMKANPRTNYEHWDTFGLKKKKTMQFMRKGLVGDFENYFGDKYLRQAYDEWIETGTTNTGLTFKYKTSSAAAAAEEG